MSEKDKTAIELIYEMHSMLTNLEKRIALLERNILLLNDKANGKMFDAISKEMPKTKTQPIDPILTRGNKTVIGPDRLQKQARSPERNLNVRVFGKFNDIRMKAIPGIEVTVYNEGNKVVKTTRTNKSGEWSSWLPPGNYSAEFLKENMAPQFKNFQIVQGQTNVEVT